MRNGCGVCRAPRQLCIDWRAARLFKCFLRLWTLKISAKTTRTPTRTSVALTRGGGRLAKAREAIVRQVTRASSAALECSVRKKARIDERATVPSDVLRSDQSSYN